MGRLSNKVAVITGGAGGIGKVTAERFLKEGAKVVLIDLFQESLDKAKAELDQYGEVIVVQADVSKESDVQNYVNKAVEHFGRIDDLRPHTRDFSHECAGGFFICNKKTHMLN
ncbi:SDR family NAD(P)-dependent oxidoreductase [Bacillus thermotolerans]|uniref:SDR family NAD(P)-dependent oxidoreductase n=1 Tax=Bacillus thermotolerans TaxID=1221996 RepID=UPI00057D9B6C|nr:SDR family NAD(P)-dependent oxidoreductase [Bacillus thermotolerans]